MANIIEEDGNFQLIMRGQPYKKMICSNNAFYINTVTGAYCGQCVILYKYDNTSIEPKFDLHY